MRHRPTLAFCSFGAKLPVLSLAPTHHTHDACLGCGVQDDGLSIDDMVALVKRFPKQPLE